MCGIAGSFNKERAFELYKSNLNRGYYSSGAIITADRRHHRLFKRLGCFNEPIQWQTPTNDSPGNCYYLYHSRGPTVETKSYEEINNHPFCYNQWVVSHNGIVSNFEKLAKEHFPEEDFTGATDSCIIPRLLYKFGIADGLSKLEGTFAIWAYNTKFYTLFIARNSSTLYANIKTGDFSSTAFEGSVLLEENSVYTLSGGSLVEMPVKIESKSPYFIL
jgi:glucosamine 6-phosphate synthetase-like amidotransferase/phosphosugar isomerase protein